MRKTETVLHGEARKIVIRGVNAVANPVKVTLGPEGAGVLLSRSFNRGSRITNDGVSVAMNVEPRDEFENLVATAFKEGAKKTGDRVGDGTTSTVVVGATLVNEGFKMLPSDGKNGVQIVGIDNGKWGVNSLRKHILSSIPVIKDAIKKRTKKIKTVSELEDVIDVSLAGNREIAKLISTMIWETGVDGFITLADGFQGKIESEIIKGARFPMKVAAPVFLNRSERYEMVAEDCYVFVTNHKIETIKDFSDFWNPIASAGVNKLVIFAPNFSEEVLVNIVKILSPKPLPNGSMVPSGYKIFPVKCPSLGSADLTPNNFVDLALFCGARFVDKDKGEMLASVKPYDLGFIQKCTVKSAEDKEDAVLVGGKGEGTKELKDHIDTLKSRIELTKLPEHKAIIEKRIASMSSAGGLIKVGAPTDAEALPLKHKIDDAKSAGIAALRHGYVKGGGLCLKEIADELFKDDKLIHAALCAPYEQIKANCGGEFTVEKNIIDPARVVELVVEHGFGVAANLITIKAIIPEFDERDPKDGYKEIASAIDRYSIYWAKDKGLRQSGIDEADAERLQKEEALMLKEND